MQERREAPVSQSALLWLQIAFVATLVIVLMGGLFFAAEVQMAAPAAPLGVMTVSSPASSESQQSTSASAFPVAPTNAPSDPQKEPTPLPPPHVAVVGGVPLAITYARLGWAQVSLAQLAPDANGMSVTPPINNQNPSMTFRPYWLTASAKAEDGMSKPVVVTGHSCSSQCYRSEWLAFNHLDQAQLGDTITLTTTGGPVVYRVTRVDSYPHDAVANAPEIWGDATHSVEDTLRLIACDPNDFTGHNVVVFADLIK